VSALVSAIDFVEQVAATYWASILLGGAVLGMLSILSGRQR
jgi:hypothetical protein